MNIKLNISERVYAIALLNQFKGDLSTLVFIIEDLKAMTIPEAEWEKAERKISTSVGDDGKPSTSWQWDDIKGGTKEIKCAEQTVKYLIDKIEEKNKAGEFTLVDRAVISLQMKLKKQDEEKKA
jgi:hypothetical protein